LPRILFLAHRVPYPPNRGDRIRTYHLLEYLAKRSELSLAYLTDEYPAAETTRVLESLCSRVAFARLGRSRWLRAGASLATGRTATEGLFSSPILRQVVVDWAREIRFDVVIAVCSSMAQYLDVPELNDVPVVVDLIDVDSQKWLDYAAQSRGVRRRMFRTEGIRLRRLECALATRARAITLVSQPEVNLFREFCPADNVYAVPNGVDLKYYQPTTAGSDHGQLTTVFIGALDYLANIDGISWFCREVWPEVRRRVPEATLQVVGSNPGNTIRRLAEVPGVEVVGPVPDVRPYVAAAAVSIAPLRVARGVQNKVLEAMAMGKPVVATPQALESIDAELGRAVVRAETAVEWQDQLIGLLRNVQECRRIGAGGRRYVESRPTWPQCLRRLHDDLRLTHEPASACGGAE